MGNRVRGYTPSGFCAVTWASRLGNPRALKVLSNGDVLVLERARATITLLWDDNKNGVSDPAERLALARLSNLNHGIAVDEQRGFLYASTAREVYRWSFRVGQRVALGKADNIISGIPCCHHTSRTLLLRPDGSLFVQVGSGSNVDENDLHARIHLFSLAQINEARGRPLSWNSGTVFAAGMRNEVGLNYDNRGRVWGVENGVDDLERPDLGPNLVYNNPGEEVNLFDDVTDMENLDSWKPKFYGYPYCWSENFLPPAKSNGKGAQWAHPHFMNTGRVQGTDSWCKDPKNVVKPMYQLPAHSAPLDIIFYNGTTLPSDYVNDAFVALHGSWDRVDPVGYAVVRLHFNSEGKPFKHSIFLSNSPRSHSADPFAENDPNYPEPPRWEHRPVGIGFGPCVDTECLYVSSDASNVIMAVAPGKN